MLFKLGGELHTEGLSNKNDSETCLSPLVAVQGIWLIWRIPTQPFPHPTIPPSPRSLGSRALLETASRFYNTQLSSRAGVPGQRPAQRPSAPVTDGLERPRAQQHLGRVCCTSSPGLAVVFFFHSIQTREKCHCPSDRCDITNTLL